MENMNYEFKDMATIDIAESVLESAHVLVEDGGVIKRVSKEIFGGSEEEGNSLFTLITEENSEYLDDDGYTIDLYKLPDGLYHVNTSISFCVNGENLFRSNTGGFDNKSVFVEKKNGDCYFLIPLTFSSMSKSRGMLLVDITNVGSGIWKYHGIDMEYGSFPWQF